MAQAKTIGGTILELDSCQENVLYMGDWYEVFEDQDGEPYFIVEGSTVYLSSEQVN